MVSECCKGCALFCRVITNLWLIAAVVLSCFAFFSCEFVKNRFTNAGIGLVRSETLVDGSYQCVRNTTVSIGGWLYRWSMVSGALSPILGSGVLFLMSFDCCCKVCCSKFMQAFVFFCALFNQACTFLIYISTACYVNGMFCTIGWGSVMSIISFVCYLIASFCLCFSPKHDPVCRRGKAEAKPAAKKEDEEAPATKRGDVEKPAEENAAEETTVAAAAVVKEEKQKPEEETDTTDIEQQQSKAEKYNVEGAPVEKEEKPEVSLEEQVFVTEEAVSVRLLENAIDPEENGNEHGEEPDGEKFVGKSIKA